MNNRIKYYRKLFDLSQQQLANLVGVTRVSITHIENGKKIPHLLLAEKISEVFGANIYEIFDLEGNDKFVCSRFKTKKVSHK